jgi:pimeloyl-ACP methyl ester carboxylesterase
MRSGILLLVLVILLFGSGCTGIRNQDNEPAFLLADDGTLSLQVPEVVTYSQLVQAGENVTVEEITFITFAGNVSSVLVSSSHPIAGVVWAPGAGVPASGHIDHLLAYGERGYAVLVVDIRGNGGKTPGYPLSLEVDYQKFISGQWPQVYLIAADLIIAERYLHDRFGSIPVWAVGESNGGRYAAQAVAADPDFSGYVGISTSGFERQGDQYEGSARDFLLSVDPEALAGRISPRPSIIFHALTDPVIPVESGERLAGALGDSAEFFRFNGTHGVNGEVDQKLIDRLNSYYRQ